MTRRFKVVDIFAGPGGLAEGFSSVRDENGKRIFDIALSIEKEPSAFATLRLRSFVRQFPDKLPREYYQYISGAIGKDDLVKAHATKWAAAERETMMLELGSGAASRKLNPELDRIGDAAKGRAILIGGPPCQAYSVMGRARNQGIEGYDAAKDQRHFLYEEYIRIIDRLKPVAFVMENVKGILSSRVNEKFIFQKVISDLQSAGGAGSYRLVPLVADNKSPHAGHILRCEDFGIPQMRHRVILLGVRTDIADTAFFKPDLMEGLHPVQKQPTVGTVLRGMPRLRSGLSRETDDAEAWREAVVAGMRAAANACRNEGGALTRVAPALNRYAKKLEQAERLRPRTGTRVSVIRDASLSDWISDPDLEHLPNHETRKHMASDFARYAFVAVFGEIHDRSPKAADFPKDLAPKHDNWKTGHFADRFRVQLWQALSSTVTSHLAKDGHYFIHPDPLQCRSLTVRETARLQTFPDNYFFEGTRTQQYVQVGNAVPPLLARKIATFINKLI